MEYSGLCYSLHFHLSILFHMMKLLTIPIQYNKQKIIIKCLFKPIFHMQKQPIKAINNSIQPTQQHLATIFGLEIRDEICATVDEIKI